MKTLKFFFFALLAVSIYSCDTWEPMVEQSIDYDSDQLRYDSLSVLTEIKIPDNTNFMYLSNISNNIMIAGTKTGGMYYSNDKGKTWALKKDLGYCINCIKYFGNEYYIGADAGLYKFNSKWEYNYTEIGPVDSNGAKVKICDLIFYTFSNTPYFNCFGFDGSNDLFFLNLRTSGKWQRSKTAILGSTTDIVEFLCSDTRVQNYNELEAYYNHTEKKYIFSPLTGTSSYVKVQELKERINSVALNKTKSGVYYLGILDGLLRYGSYSVSSPTKYFQGKEVFSVFCSSNGTIYVSTDNGIYYSIDDCQNWERIYYNDDNPEIRKFYQVNNLIFSQSSNGKLYSFYDFSLSNHAIGPNLYYPGKGNYVGNDVLLKWYGNNYSDTTDVRFDVQVSNSDKFDDLIINQKKYSYSGLQLNNLMSGKTYYWRVRTTTSNHNYFWSSSWFTVK